MWRMVTICLWLASSAAAWAGDDPSGDPGTAALAGDLKSALRAARESYGDFTRWCTSQTGGALRVLREKGGDLAEWEPRIAAAAARLEVDPRAERAAVDMRRGEFGAALVRLQRLLADKSDDPYASYLAGICAAELQRYREGARHFARALEGEPESHTARLLREFCNCAAERSTPLSHEDVLDCYAAGLEEAEEHVTVVPPEDEKDLDAALKWLVRTPEVLRDPLLYKLASESMAGRGPQTIDANRVAEAALASEDTYELALGCIVAEKKDLIEKLEARLAAPEHAAALRGLIFMLEYFDGQHDHRRRDHRYDERLAELRQLMPDEGAWMLFTIPLKDLSDDTLLPPPLSAAELKLWEKAGSAPRFTVHRERLEAAAVRLLRRSGYPWAGPAGEWLGTIVRGEYSYIRNVLRQGQTLVAERLGAGDIREGLRAAAACRRLADRIAPSGKDVALLAALVRAAHEETIAETVLERLPSSHTAAWLEYQQLRLQGRAVSARARTMAALVDPVASALPLTVIGDTQRRLVDNRWPAWKLELLQTLKDSEDQVDKHRQRLVRAQEPGERVHVDTLLDVALLKQRQLLPEVRQLRDMPLEDEDLWVLVWALGQLQDEESVDWLTARLDDPRQWLRITAEEALNKIRHGEGLQRPR